MFDKREIISTQKFDAFFKTCIVLPAGDLVTSRQHQRCFMPQAVNTV